MTEECKTWTGEGGKAVFVDIGGASGQQCVEFKKRFPGIGGRVVLQDLPAVVKEVMEKGLEGVGVMGYDFFTAQPIQGMFSGS